MTGVAEHVVGAKLVSQTEQNCWKRYDIWAFRWLLFFIATTNSVHGINSFITSNGQKQVFSSIVGMININTSSHYSYATIFHNTNHFCRFVFKIDYVYNQTLLFPKSRKSFNSTRYLKNHEYVSSSVCNNHFHNSIYFFGPLKFKLFKPWHIIST